MKNIICIVCPKGCHLSVDEENGYVVAGHGCLRGAAYGQKELQNPTRVVTSTVRIEGGAHKRLPVKTSGDIPRNMVLQAVALLDDITVTAPVCVGDVIIPDILGTGISFVATRGM